MFGGKWGPKKFIKIIGDRVIPEWWRDRDHRLNMDDVGDILSTGPVVLVVGTGYAENMRVEKGLLRSMEKEKIRLVAQDTRAAVKSFFTILQKNCVQAFPTCPAGGEILVERTM